LQIIKDFTDFLWWAEVLVLISQIEQPGNLPILGKQAEPQNHEIRINLGKKKGAPNQGPFYKPPSSST
jgi:hypothetical protein